MISLPFRFNPFSIHLGPSSELVNMQIFGPRSGIGSVLIGIGSVLIGIGTVLIGIGSVLIGTGMVLIGIGMVLIGSPYRDQELGRY